MAWYNDWGDFEDALIDGYSYITGTDAEVNKAATHASEKQLQKELIKHVHAPIRKGERDDIKNFFDKYIETIATETKGNLKSVAGKLDDEIKGKLSNSIQQTINTKVSKYDKL